MTEGGYEAVTHRSRAPGGDEAGFRHRATLLEPCIAGPDTPLSPGTSADSRSFDRRYSRFARAYDLAVKLLPTWRRWLSHALPHIQGPRVLEVSPGTGWLLTQYAGSVVAHAIDLNHGTPRS